MNTWAAGVPRHGVVLSRFEDFLRVNEKYMVVDIPFPWIENS